MTNAETAIMAAARLYSGRDGYYLDSVLSAAYDFKEWLDKQDKADNTTAPVGFTKHD